MYKQKKWETKFCNFINKIKVKRKNYYDIFLLSTDKPVIFSNIIIYIRILLIKPLGHFISIRTKRNPSKKNCPSHILELLHGITTRDYEFIRFFKNIFFFFLLCLIVLNWWCTCLAFFYLSSIILFHRTFLLLSIKHFFIHVLSSQHSLSML